MAIDHVRMETAPVSALLRLDGGDTTINEGNAKALPWTDVAAGGHNADWTYSTAAESNGDEAGTAGEAAITDVVEDLDLDPGMIYVGTSGRSVHIDVSNLDIGGSIHAIPEATDEFTVGVFINNKLIKTADEGFVAEADIATEFNVTGAYHANIQNLDVVRVALISQEGGAEDSISYQSTNDQAIVTIR